MPPLIKGFNCEPFLNLQRENNPAQFGKHTLKGQANLDVNNSLEGDPKINSLIGWDKTCSTILGLIGLLLSIPFTSKGEYTLKR